MLQNFLSFQQLMIRNKELYISIKDVLISRLQTKYFFKTFLSLILFISNVI